MHRKDELGVLSINGIGRMKRSRCWILFFLLAPVAVAPEDAQPLLGYDEEAVIGQRQLENAFDELLAADDLRQLVNRMLDPMTGEEINLGREDFFFFWGGGSCIDPTEPAK